MPYPVGVVRNISGSRMLMTNSKRDIGVHDGTLCVNPSIFLALNEHVQCCVHERPGSLRVCMNHCAIFDWISFAVCMMEERCVIWSTACTMKPFNNRYVCLAHYFVFKFFLVPNHFRNMVIDLLSQYPEFRAKISN